MGNSCRMKFPGARSKPEPALDISTFHPDGRHAYVINELDSTVTAFDYEPETGTLNAETDGADVCRRAYEGTSHCADVHVSPSGRFLYGSNRGHDSIAIFAIDQDIPASLRSSITSPLRARHRETLRSSRRGTTCSPPTRIRTRSSLSRSTKRLGDWSRPARSHKCRCRYVSR